MSDISTKLQYLNTTKGKIKDVINMTGANITSDTTFRNYATKLYDGYINVLKDKNTLLDNMPKGTSTGTITDAADLPVYEDKLSKESTQETTILPSGYTQVDYIESTGTQYINTGYSNANSNNMMIDIVFSVTEFNETGFGFYGASLSNNQNRRTCMLWSNAPEVLKISSGITISAYSQYTGSYIMGQKNRKVIYCDLNTNKYTVDDSQEYSFESSAKNTNNILIFSPDPEVAQNFKGKLYKFKLYANNTLIRDFIPCYRNSDNKPGLYDYINNVFYTNQGTGEFVVGNIVLPPTEDFPTPSPDYPQEVKTVKGYRNLFDIADGTYTVGTGPSASFTFKDGVLTSLTHDFSQSFGIKIPLRTPITLNANQPYTRSNGRNQPYPYLTLYDINSNVVNNMGYADNGIKTYTPDTQKEIYYLYLWCDYRVDYTGMKPMMSEGSTSLPFVPYGTNWIYTAVSNGTDTNYYTIPLNGNEIAGKGINLDELIIDKHGHCFINKKFAKIDSYNGETITTDYWSTTGGLDTGATIYYVLETPQLIDLNYTVDLTLFEGVNNISNSEDMDMDIKYIKDTYE